MSPRFHSRPSSLDTYSPELEVMSKLESSRRRTRKFPAEAKASSFASQCAPASEEKMRLRCTITQTCEPSAEASSDCAACLTNSSLPADFHEIPRSRETSTPALVAAYHAALVKVRSLTWEARS